MVIKDRNFYRWRVLLISKVWCNQKIDAIFDWLWNLNKTLQIAIFQTDLSL